MNQQLSTKILLFHIWPSQRQAYLWDQRAAYYLQLMCVVQLCYNGGFYLEIVHWSLLWWQTRAQLFKWPIKPQDYFAWLKCWLGAHTIMCPVYMYTPLNYKYSPLSLKVSNKNRQKEVSAWIVDIILPLTDVCLCINIYRWIIQSCSCWARVQTIRLLYKCISIYDSHQVLVFPASGLKFIFHPVVAGNRQGSISHINKYELRWDYCCLRSTESQKLKV